MFECPNERFYEDSLNVSRPLYEKLCHLKSLSVPSKLTIKLLEYLYFSSFLLMNIIKYVVTLCL